jgi:hypothetical protein
MVHIFQVLVNVLSVMLLSNENSNQREPDRQMCDSAASCAMDQQYCSATLHSLHVYFRDEDVGARLKMLLFLTFVYVWNFCNLKLGILGSACDVICYIKL